MTVTAERDLYRQVLIAIRREGRELGRCIDGKDCCHVHCWARRILYAVDKERKAALPRKGRNE